MTASLGVSGLPRPAGLVEVDTVLDIGPGIRPMGWYKPKQHICIEPHGSYADMLVDAGYETWRVPALAALRYHRLFEADAIYMLDVIEHMWKPVAEEVILLAKEMRPRQIVIATPFGFLKQEGDAWGLGGEYWQKHRSGWLPEEFPGWTISRYDNGTRQGGFVAMWQP